MSSPLSENSALRWATLLFCAATLYVGWPLWPALVMAAWTAVLARPLLLRLERVLKGRRRAAVALSLILFLVLLIPLSLLVLGVGAGAQELALAVSRANSAKSALEDLAVGGAPPTQTIQLPGNFAETVDLVQRYGSQTYDVTRQIAGAATRGLIELFIYFAGTFTFMVDGDRTWRWLRRNSPLKPEYLDRFALAFHETGRGLLIGVGLTSATQALAATVAYLALGVPRALVLGPITGVASMVPFVGTTLVWGPIAVGLYLTGKTVKAVILVVIGVAVIGSIDNILRPVYARLGTLKMPTFLLFVSVFGGLSAFGAWGAILGPLIVRMTMEVLSMRREAEAEVAEQAAQDVQS